MTAERQIVIIKGEEFKLSVKDKISEKDIFYDQYISAARMLDDIVAVRENTSDLWCDTEYENNIIAFCGERGEGKSSAMISFVKAVYECGKSGTDSVFKDCENVKNAYFAEPIVIDPSMLDGVHNVLDIVIAKLYKKFKDMYDADNQVFDAYNREKLLDQFQKVYKSVSLINNQDKMLDDEYDYEGNIGKLSKLGQSTELKKELMELVNVYMNIMPSVNKAKGKSGNLLIAIDDLDLCSFHAYKMSEQIRKYLIIPNVVIVMAIRSEQLEMCVREKNFRKYKATLSIGKQAEGAFEEIISMSERYVAKLIPKARRNYLPNVRMMHNVKILYRDQSGNDLLNMNLGDSVNDILLQLIYKKTGMMFLQDKSGKNYFLPDNLRDMINILAVLAGMEEPHEDNTIYYENIRKFSGYYERQWLFGNMELKECREIQRLMHDQTQLHENTIFLLELCHRLTEKKIYTFPVQFLPETSNSFFRVMNWMEVFHINVFGEEEKKYAYAFRILYTIRLNEFIRLEQYDELVNFMGGYIWAGNFQNFLPYVGRSLIDRSRFILPTVCTFNTIAKALYPNKNIGFVESAESQYYVAEILKQDEDRKAKIVSWVLLGLLSNTYQINPSYQTIYTYEMIRVIFSNHAVLQNLHISLENYIVGLCNLKSLYFKVNMGDLGIDLEEFEMIVEEIQESNKEMIIAYRKFASNVDIIMEFKEYCSKRREIKESGLKDDLERSETAVKIYFNNMKGFLKEFFGIQLEKPDYLKLKYEDGKSEISISRLYALLVQAGVDREENISVQDGKSDRERLVKEFATKLRDRTGAEVPLERVSSYLVTKTARNAKSHMDNLASNIRRYYSMHMEERLEEVQISELCSYYGKILDIFLINPVEEVSEDLCREYKTVVKRYQKTCQ
ncbi:hypothetical protein D7X88_10500 [bacterium C-53]|nr:hypothetical protein [Lachnospiraceae bacterium]NBI03467.1 hypothetical protein [Lachnospiraceae bacterium]RKJ09705.1 hypothetical protein D7X88_10500 [bacterium C-53]